jgi:hypothetical protein
MLVTQFRSFVLSFLYGRKAYAFIDIVLTVVFFIMLVGARSQTLHINP